MSLGFFKQRKEMRFIAACQYLIKTYFYEGIWRQMRHKIVGGLQPPTYFTVK